VKKDGVTVEVSIIRLEHETEWSLEVVNSATARLPWGGDSTIIPPSNAPTRSRPNKESCQAVGLRDATTGITRARARENP